MKTVVEKNIILIGESALALLGQLLRTFTLLFAASASRSCCLDWSGSFYVDQDSDFRRGFQRVRQRNPLVWPTCFYVYGACLVK